jgi:uncharacterized protein YndB with AHSA1/START domain
MNQAKHIYVVYIATTAEKLWKAITQGELAGQYWGHENVSDWKVGSRWSHVTADQARQERIVGKVIEVTPPTRLVMSWADPKLVDDKTQHSKVSFDIEPLDDMVKLTVTHDELVADSNMERGITKGWPLVLSSMKSFLETGKGLDIWATKKTA